MRITQGTFSYLPDLTDDEIRMQVQFGIDNGWHPQIEFTDDPHPRNVYWHMWGLPMFDLADAQAVVNQVNACREAYPSSYVRVTLYDAGLGRATSALQFLVNRPPDEPGFQLERQESHDRAVRYTLRSYATNDPKGHRYGGVT